MVQIENEANSNAQEEKLPEVRYEYSNNLASILNHLGITLFFFTYQAGKLGVVTAKDNTSNISFHNFN